MICEVEEESRKALCNFLVACTIIWHHLLAKHELPVGTAGCLIATSDEVKDVLNSVLHKQVLPIVTDEAIALTRDEVGSRARVDDRSMDIVHEVVQVEQAPPARCLHILEREASARQCRIAANDAWREDRVVHLNVVQSDALDVDKVVGHAGSERV